MQPTTGRAAALFLFASLALGLAPACSSDDKETEPADAGAAPPACALEFLGDPTKEPVLELTARGVDGTSVPLEENGTIPIITPPQGGRVLFMGVRATNLSPCAVKLAGSFRDPVTQQIRIDTRIINLKATGDGWGGSNDTDLSSFANVPVCPNQWAQQDIFDQTFELTVALTAKDGTKVSKTLHVTPTCAESDSEDAGPLHTECLCICKAGYVLGETCDGAGGAGGGA